MMKKQFSKILAVFCAVVMVVNAIGVQSLAETDTASASLTELTFSDFGLVDNTYAGAGGIYNNAATLVGTQISGYVTLNEDLKNAAGDAWLSFGYNGWGGLMLYFKVDGSLHVNTGSTAEKNPYNYVINPANLQSMNGKDFCGTKVKLTLSLEEADLDNDNAKDDVLLKLYINDEPAIANPTGNDALYGCNGEYYILDAVESQLEGYLITQQIGIEGFCSDITFESYVPALTELSFSDFGLNDDTYTYVRGVYNEGASLAGTKFSGYITLNENLTSAGAGAWLVLGGTAGLPSSSWDGIQIQFEPDGKTVNLNQGSVTDSNGFHYVFRADNNEGITTFAGAKFKLTVLLEKANLDNGATKNDILVKLYINDHLWVANDTGNAALYGANGSYYILNAKTENLQGYLAAQQIGASGLCSDITFESVEKGTGEPAPEEPDEMKELTFTDFNLANGTHSMLRGVYNGGASLIGTSISGYITWNEDMAEAGADPWLIVGSTVGLPDSGWDGVQVHFFKDGTGLHINDGSVTGTNPYQYTFLVSNNEGITSFVGTKFKFTISFESANLDGGTQKNDVLVKLYINDNLWVANDTGNATLYGENGSYYILNAKTGNLQGYLNSQQTGVSGLCSDVTIESIGSGTQEPGPGEPEDPKDPEEPVELTELTFIDFNLADNRYTSVRGTYKDGASLVGTQVSGYITLNEDLTSATSAAYVVFGGTTGLPDSGWDGVQLVFEPDGKTVKLNQGSATDTNPWAYTYSADSNEGVTTFAGEKVKVKVTFESANVDGSAEADDIIVKLYINDNLWVANDTGNATLYGENGACYILNAKTDNLQGNFAIQQIGIEDFCSDVILESLDGKGKETIDKPALHKVTLGQLGITEALYKYNNNDLVTSGAYVNSLMNSVFSTEVTFSAHDGSRIMYGGKPSAWHGINFTAHANGNIMIHPGEGEFPETYWLTPEVAGTTLVGEEINLKIELFKSGENAKLGVYINGELYDGSYFHLSDAADAFGNFVGFYVGDEKGSIKIGVPEPAPVVNQNFKQLTFDSYDIETGTYSYDVLGLAVSGHCDLESLDRVVFSDTVQFSKAAGTSLRIGGKPSAWHGLVFNNTEDGKLMLNEAEGKMPTLYFDPATAGTALVGKDIKLQLSFEYVDSDDDGKKDDVKLGVWFNGKAYGDRWFYLQDIAEVLGGYLSIYCANEDAYLNVYTYHVPIDYTIWGFTKRWAYELGLRK